MEAGASSAWALSTHTGIWKSALTLGFFYKAVFMSQKGVSRAEAKSVLGILNKNCSHVCLQQAPHRAELEIHCAAISGNCRMEGVLFHIVGSVLAFGRAVP